MIYGSLIYLRVCSTMKYIYLLLMKNQSSMWLLTTFIGVIAITRIASAGDVDLMKKKTNTNVSPTQSTTQKPKMNSTYTTKSSTEPQIPTSPIAVSSTKNNTVELTTTTKHNLEKTTNLEKKKDSEEIKDLNKEPHFTDKIQNHGEKINMAAYQASIITSNDGSSTHIYIFFIGTVVLVCFVAYAAVLIHKRRTLYYYDVINRTIASK